MGITVPSTLTATAKRPFVCFKVGHGGDGRHIILSLQRVEYSRCMMGPTTVASLANPRRRLRPSKPDWSTGAIRQNLRGNDALKGSRETNSLAMRILICQLPCIAPKHVH